LSQRSPGKAQSELEKLSASISTNRAALDAESSSQVNNPLDRLQSSSAKSGNGSMSVSDFRNQDWLRG